MSSSNTGFSKIINFTSKTVITNWLFEEKYTSELIAKDINDVLLIMFKGYDVKTKVTDDNTRIKVECHIHLGGEFIAIHEYEINWEELNV